MKKSEMLNEKLTEDICNQLKELDWNSDTLEEMTNIPLLRLTDILHGDSTPTVEEQKTLINALKLKEGIKYQEVKLDIMISFLSDLGVERGNIDFVLQYVKENVV